MFIGTYQRGGNADKDLYSWKIFGPNNALLFSRGPGSFPKIDITFSRDGLHTIELEVSRGGISVGKYKKLVEVVPKPSILLKNEYFICPDQSLALAAIDSLSSNFSLYEFEWKDETGAVISTSNTLTISHEGQYRVRYFLITSQGERGCENEISTRVKVIPPFSIVGNSTSLCSNAGLTFSTNPMIIGEWFIQKTAGFPKKSLGKGTSIKINPADIPSGFGEYELSFVLENADNPTCSPEEKINFVFNPLPSLVLESASGASDCLAEDGSLTIRSETDLDLLIIEGKSISLGPFSKDDLIQIPKLPPGTYQVTGILGSCFNGFGAVVPVVATPLSLQFEISDILGEGCTSNGKSQGSFKVILKNGPNPDIFYRIFNERGIAIKEEAFPSSGELTLKIFGGTYLFEVFTNSDTCILPWKETVKIPSKNQTLFDVPNQINVCKVFSFIPKTNQSLVFNLLKPDLTSETKKSGEAFLLDQAGEYRLIGSIPNQNAICPTEKIFKVNLLNPVNFEVELSSEDCIIGNKFIQPTYWELIQEDFFFIGETTETNSLAQVCNFFYLQPLLANFLLKFKGQILRPAPLHPQNSWSKNLFFLQI